MVNKSCVVVSYDKARMKHGLEFAGFHFGR